MAVKIKSLESGMQEDITADNFEFSIINNFVCVSRFSYKVLINLKVFLLQFSLIPR